MQNLPDRYKDLLAAGRSFRDKGLQEVGLPKSEALRAVRVLREAGVGVLGADVWACIRGEWGIAGNWYAEPKTGEDELEFAIRSCEQAATYVSQFPELDGCVAFFVLVTR